MTVLLLFLLLLFPKTENIEDCVHTADVCVCVCERERERESIKKSNACLMSLDLKRITIAIRETICVIAAVIQFYLPELLLHHE